MPYKAGKLKGQLTGAELRKLIRAHNILVSIKIPKGTDRDGLIKLINMYGYKIDHEKKEIIAGKRPRKPNITLDHAEILTKPKPLTEEQKKKRQQAQQKRKGEKAFLKQAIPKPPAPSKPAKKIKIGKPPPKPPPKPKFKIDQSKQPKTTPSEIKISKKPPMSSKKIEPKKVEPKKPAPKKQTKQQKTDEKYEKEVKPAIIKEVYPIILKWLKDKDDPKLLATIQNPDGTPLKKKKGMKKSLFVKKREEYDKELQKKMKEVMKKFGFSVMGSGYNYSKSEAIREAKKIYESKKNKEQPASKKVEPSKPKFKIDQSKQPKTTPSEIKISVKPPMSSKKIESKKVETIKSLIKFINDFENEISKLRRYKMEKDGKKGIHEALKKLDEYRKSNKIENQVNKLGDIKGTKKEISKINKEIKNFQKTLQYTFDYLIDELNKKEDPKEQQKQVEEDLKKIKKYTLEEYEAKKKGEFKKKQEEKEKKAPVKTIKSKDIDIKNYDDFYNKLFDALSSRSKRSFNTFSKSYPDFKDKINKILEGQQFLDFYPTPLKCLEKSIPVVKRASKILEPTAGLGAITYFLSKYTDPSNITAVELDKTMSKLLQEIQPKLNVKTGNFLNMSYKNWKDIDCIYCNPPFTMGSDKRFYYDFLFRCLAILNHNGGGELVFICPSLVEKDELENFDMSRILNKRAMSNPKYQKIMKEYSSNPPTKAGHNKYLDDGEYKSELFEIFDFQEARLLEQCSGFGGTKITADVYLFIV